MDPLASTDRRECNRFESSLDQLAPLLSWFEQFNQPPLPPEIWIQGQTGLVEAFSNAVRHAHRDMVPRPPVEVDVVLGPEGVRIEVVDRGPPYDLDAALEIVRGLVNAPEFDPLDREAHWGHVLLLRLRDQHGWQVTYGPGRDGANRFALAHPLGRPADSFVGLQ